MNQSSIIGDLDDITSDGLISKITCTCDTAELSPEPHVSSLIVYLTFDLMDCKRKQAYYISTHFP